MANSAKEMQVQFPSASQKTYIQLHVCNATENPYNFRSPLSLSSSLVLLRNQISDSGSTVFLAAALANLSKPSQQYLGIEITI